MFYFNLIFFRYGKGFTKFNLARDICQTLKWTKIYTAYCSGNVLCKSVMSMPYAAQFTLPYFTF